MIRQNYRACIGLLSTAGVTDPSYNNQDDYPSLEIPSKCCRQAADNDTPAARAPQN